jgi:hypothetical protein
MRDAAKPLHQVRREPPAQLALVSERGVLEVGASALAGDRDPLGAYVPGQPSLGLFPPAIAHRDTWRAVMR